MFYLFVHQFIYEDQWKFGKKDRYLDMRALHMYVQLNLSYNISHKLYIKTHNSVHNSVLLGKINQH